MSSKKKRAKMETIEDTVDVCSYMRRVGFDMDEDNVKAVNNICNRLGIHSVVNIVELCIPVVGIGKVWYFNSLVKHKGHKLCHRLLNCPFCGSSDLEINIKHVEEQDIFYSYIRCRVCRGSCGSSKARNRDDVCDSVEEAILKWNERYYGTD